MIGLSQKETEARIAAHQGKFYKKVPQGNRQDAWVYSLPIPKGEKKFPYLVVSYQDGKAMVLQLSGDKTDAPLAFSSIKLGDTEARVKEFLGPPDSISPLEDVPGYLWNYLPFPFTLELNEGKVNSIRIRAEDAAQPTVQVDKGIGQVTQYLMKTEYLEKFGDVEYRVRVIGDQSIDFFGDGNTLVFLAVQPHYLQSPSIVLFKIDKGGQVTRVSEALAPGPLIPPTGNYLDSHPLKEAVDMTVDGSPMEVVKASLQQHSYVVRYAKFFHVDNRVGSGGYLDMSDHTEFGAEKTCENFEFSTVDDFRAGKVARVGKGNRLAVLVGEHIYLYDIKAISRDGFLDKTVKAYPKPGDFKSFSTESGPSIRYVTNGGKTKDWLPGK